MFYLLNSCITSVLEYSCQVFHTSLPQYLSDEVERIQKRALKIIFQTSITKKQNLELCLKEEKLCVKCYFVISRLQMSTRHKLCNLLPAKRGPCNHERRHKRVYSLPLIKTNRFKNHLLCTMQPRPLDSSNFIIIFIVCI